MDMFLYEIVSCVCLCLSDETVYMYEQLLYC